MRKIKILCLMMALALLTGCGKREKVEYIDDTISTEEQACVVSPSKNLKESLGVSEEWIEYVDEENSIQINVTPVVPDTDGMKVIQLETKNYYENPEGKKEFLGMLTDEPVYIYEQEFWPKSEWEREAEKRYDFYLAIEAWDDSAPNKPDMIEYALSEYDYAISMADSSKEEWTEATDYTNNQYKIRYEGCEYIVSFEDHSAAGLGYNYYYYEAVVMTLYDMSVVAQTEGGGEVMLAPYVSYDYNQELGENRCSLTEEEATKLGDRFVADINVSDFDVSSIEPLLIGAGSDMYYDGYVVSYSRKVDESMVVGEDYFNSRIMWNQLGEVANNSVFSGPYKYFEEIKVYVNDLGIVQVKYCNPYEVLDVSEKNISLLDFDNIKAVVINELTTNSYNYNYANFDNLELTYFTYLNEDNRNEVAIIPVWKLTQKTAGDITYYVIVNAIDGSILNLSMQFHEPEIE